MNSGLDAVNDEGALSQKGLAVSDWLNDLPEVFMVGEVVIQKMKEQEERFVKMDHHMVFRSGALDKAGLSQSFPVQDITTFNNLVAEHQDSLYWWVFSLVKDEAMADDITQETFIKAYEKLSAFRGGSFKAWLFTIARNSTFDELRRKKRHPTLSLNDSPEEDLERLAIIPDGAPLPEDALITAEHTEFIDQMINNLPDLFQQVVRLIDIEGLDYQEAADILGLPLGTVKSRITRARLKMRLLFQENSWI